MNTTPAAAAPATPPSLAARLHSVQVGLRRDLEVTRHLFRSEIAYVIRDPLTLAHHRLGCDEYAILVELDAERTLGALFTELVERGRLRADGEESFYRFIYSLHRLGFLALPIEDERALYQRAEQQRESRRRRWWTAFLSLQIPLWNPDHFLQRTLPWVRPLFSRAGALLWLATVLLGGAVIVANFGEFSAPIVDLLDGRNLPLLWATLIVLKVFHEFGHAYACRHFGGIVPRMGVNLILLTPTAYVDATSCWSFTRRWQRVLVCLGGMAVELFLAALAAFVWAVTPPGPLHSLAHGVVVMASAVTITFNLNPFLRYDGYHALCDLLELPNLRARADEYTLALARRLLLGVPVERPPAQRRLRAFLVAFSVGCAVAQVGLMLGLCVAIAHQYYAVGVLLGAGYIVTRCAKLLRGAVGGLLQAAATPELRARALAATVLLLGVGPVALLGLPLPPRLVVAGVSGRLAEVSVCATSDGFLEERLASARQALAAGAPVARLHDPTLAGEVEAAAATVEQARLRVAGIDPLDPLAQESARERLAQAEAEFAAVVERRAGLRITAPIAGELVVAPSAAELGRFVRRGEPLATIVDGPPCVRALLTEEEWLHAKPRVGDPVEFRCATQPDVVRRGTLEAVSPIGARDLDPRFAALAESNGGSIAIDPTTEDASQAHFALLVRLDGDALPLGATGALRSAAPPKSVADQAWRWLVRFGQRLRESR